MEAGAARTGQRLDVGLIGFGSIGQALATRALSLGAKVVAVRRRQLPSGVDGVRLVDSLGEVAEAADHLVLALPATPSTRNIVDASVLARAKPTAHLINVARGYVLDPEALMAALDGERLAFATPDVTEPEPLPAAHRLWTHPKVRLTPHVSSNYTTVRALSEVLFVNLRKLTISALAISQVLAAPCARPSAVPGNEVRRVRSQHVFRLL